MKNRAIFEKWIAEYGSDKIILGADANNEKVAVSGWLEDSNKDLVPFIQDYQGKEIQYVICTDIAKDGMLEGPSFDLYAKILKEASGIKLIASGGISTFDELPKLAELGCEGTIIGRSDLRRSNFIETIGKLYNKIDYSAKKHKEDAKIH